MNKTKVFTGSASLIVSLFFFSVGCSKKQQMVEPSDKPQNAAITVSADKPQHAAVATTARLPVNFISVPSWGGGGGTPFNHINALRAAFNPSPKKIFIRERNHRVVGVGVVLLNGTVLYNGGTDGTDHQLTLEPGEYFWMVKIYTGNPGNGERIVHLRVITNRGRILIGGGLRNGDEHTLEAPEGYMLAGFHGATSDHIHALGLIYVNRFSQL